MLNKIIRIILEKIFENLQFNLIFNAKKNYNWEKIEN